MRKATKDNADSIHYENIDHITQWVGLYAYNKCYILSRLDDRQYAFVCIDDTYKTPIHYGEFINNAVLAALDEGTDVFVMDDIEEMDQFFRMEYA